MGFFYFLYVYFLGGITFLPLLIFAIFVHARLTLPHVDPRAFAEDFEDPLRDAGDEDKYIKSGGAASLDERFKGKRDSDIAEGYYAVCREYVPGGVNGKPPEKPAGAGELTPESSPSIYNLISRGFFSPKQQPTLEPNKNVGRFSKKPRNVFYVVLRHGHLMLYDDEHQVEVRHVISLAHHKIDVYGGGSEIPEGELWIKRNAIRLTRRDEPTDSSSSSKPLYFFSENCSDKEDFYHALLQCQERIAGETENPPTTLHFDNQHVINLIQKLHSSEEQFQTRWLNALIGRWFLSMYKTQFIEDLVRMKITKKIARVQKPAFLTGIILRSIDMGRAAPLITNPKLRDLTMDGNCSVEADLHYEGNVRVEIAATIRIDLGTRFKAREVELILAVTLKKLSGHGIVRFKPPPSNRLWITFETMPKMELSIEPIWGSRHITYGLVLRQIESRIREVFAETLVMPFWDDIPFYDTEKLRCRGGIWTEDGQGSQPHETHVPDEMPHQEQDTAAITITDENLAGTANLVEPGSKGFFYRKGHKPAPSNDSTSALSSGIERQRSEMPRPMRSTSSTAAPTVSTSNADTIGVRDGRAGKDAVSLMREISTRSPPSSPPDTPMATSYGSNRDRSVSPYNTKRPSVSSVQSGTSALSTDGTLDLGSSQSTVREQVRDSSPSASLNSRSSAQSNTSTQSKAANKLAKLAESLTPSEARQAQLAAISAAAANATANASRSWTWGSKKGKHSNSPSISSNSGLFGHSPSNSTSGTGINTPTNSGEPYGRGRPLPPPGTPLPPPERATTFAGAASSWMGGMKRKGVGAAQAPPPSASDKNQQPPNRKDSISSMASAGSEVKRRPVPSSSLPARRVSQAGLMQQRNDSNGSDVVVVTAPPGSSGSDVDPGVKGHDEALIDLDEGQTHHGTQRGFSAQRAEDDDLDAIAEGGLPGEAAADLIEADLATPLATGRRLEAKPSTGLEIERMQDNTVAAHKKGLTGNTGSARPRAPGDYEEREDLTASEILARESILPADLEGP